MSYKLILFGSLLCGFPLLIPCGGIEHHRSTDEDGCVSTEADTEDEGYRETTDGLASEDRDGKHCHEGGYGCIHGSGEGAVESDVRIVLEVSLRMEGLVLTDSVEDDHVVVDRITDDGKDGGNEGLVNVEVERKDSGEQGEETDDDDSRVCE